MRWRYVKDLLHATIGKMRDGVKDVTEKIPAQRAGKQRMNFGASRINPTRETTSILCPQKNS